MEKNFENILDKDEQIIKVFKPNKAKLYASSILRFVFVTMFILAGFILSVISTIYESNLYYGSGYADVYVNLLVIALVIYIAILLVIWLLTRVYYNKLFYAYTNKRIIIRTGIIGVDYKSLDMGMIGAVNVNISLLDKIIRKNTGTISFGSMASPVMGMGNAAGPNAYRFANIKQPYEVYKELKSAIDDYKASNK